MYEYWFLDPDENHTGTTSDFLEVLCRITEVFGSSVTGKFVAALMEDQRDSLAFLRVIDWKFEYIVSVNDDIGVSTEIKLHKVS